MECKVQRRHTEARAPSRILLNYDLRTVVASFLKPPTVARVKKVDEVLDYALSVERMNLASFETIVLDLTCTEQMEQGEGSAEAESNSSLVVHAFLRGVVRAGGNGRDKGNHEQYRRHSKTLLVRCELPMPWAVRALQDMFAPHFSAVNVVAWSPLLALATTIVETPWARLALLDARATTGLHLQLAERGHEEDEEHRTTTTATTTTTPVTLLNSALATGLE